MPPSSDDFETRYREGELVEVFYRMNQEEGYFPVPNHAARCLKPRFGRTDGWMTARVIEDWPPERQVGEPPGKRTAPVRVRHIHELWANRYGQSLDPERDRDMVVFVTPCDVRPLPPPGKETTQVTLSLLIVRWGGEETDFNVEQWGAASSSTSDAYVSTFVDSTVYRRLGPDYEVFTAFVTSGADLAKLQPSAICASMTGRHKAGCYFLWPVMAQDVDVHESGMVDQSHYFATVSLFEAAGVCTRFPHPSQLYRQILAKEWQPALCLVPHLRIPPATMVNRASVMASPQRAAQLVSSALSEIRATRYQRKPEPEALRVHENEVRRGVAKLGFAWEAAHVRVYRGEAQLATALYELCGQPGVTSAHVIVQDFARNDFELRQFVVNGRVHHRVYSNFAWTDSDGYMREFVMKDRSEAVRDWMSGDERAMAAAERKAANLVDAWLTWLRCQSVECLPAVRMDMLVRRKGPGAAEVFTLELTELGFSMLTWPAGPSMVFGALLESCFADTGPTPEEAVRLGLGEAMEGEASTGGGHTVCTWESEHTEEDVSAGGSAITCKRKQCD